MQLITKKFAYSIDFVTKEMCVTSKLIEYVERLEDDCNYALHTLSDHNVSTRNPGLSMNYHVLKTF